MQNKLNSAKVGCLYSVLINNVIFFILLLFIYYICLLMVLLSITFVRTDSAVRFVWYRQTLARRCVKDEYSDRILLVRYA